MIKQHSLTLLSHAVNTVLRLNTHHHEKLIPLAGKIVQLTILPLRVSFFLRFSAARVDFIDTCDQTPDTVIESTPIGFIRLSFLPPSKTRSLFYDSVVLRGDMHTGEQVKALFDIMDIDWETCLARITGDVAAYHIGQNVTRLWNKLHHIQSRTQENITEYLQEETQLMPSQEAIEDFFRDIDALQDTVARLAARIERYQKT